MTTSRTLNKAKRLKKKIEAYILKEQMKEQKLMGGDTAYAPGGKYDGFADVGIWIGEDVAKYCEYPNTTLVLHYDGAGYDYLSYNGDMCDWRYRGEIEAIGKECGFDMEDHNGWSMGFYLQ